MQYRMYSQKIKIGAIFLFSALAFSACSATTIQAERKPGSVDTQQSDDSHGDTDKPSGGHKFDGREPSSMQGDFTWLNDVEDDFGRIAAETSTRAVASQNQHDVLLKQKEWTFSYLPKTNHFYIDLQGTEYQMVQTKIDDGERFAFAAEGQAENPLTLSVTKGEGRTVASGDDCAAELSYWNKNTKSYVTDKKTVRGKNCEHLLALLKDYVP